MHQNKCRSVHSSLTQVIGELRSTNQNSAQAFWVHVSVTPIQHALSHHPSTITHQRPSKTSDGDGSWHEEWTVVIR